MTHPDILEAMNLRDFDSKVKDRHIQHYFASTLEQVAKGLNVASTYLLPNASMNNS